MLPFFVGIVSCLGVFFRYRYYLGLEILALRQQLGREVWKLHLLEFNDGCGMNALFREIGPGRT